MQRFLCVLLAAVSCSLAQDEKPAPTIPDLLQTARAAYMHADYEAARQSLVQAWDMAQETPPEAGR